MDYFFDSFNLNHFSSEALLTCGHLQVVFVIHSQADCSDHMCSHVEITTVSQKPLAIGLHHRHCICTPFLFSKLLGALKHKTVFSLS